MGASLFDSTDPGIGDGGFGVGLRPGISRLARFYRQRTFRRDRPCRPPRVTSVLNG